MKNKPLGRSLMFEPLEMRLALSTVVAATSTNWSGYAVTASNNTVSYVSGTWTVPTVTASSSSSTGYCAVWVGIDGYNSSTVEQIGTESEISNGVTTYYAWYEMYPSASVTITSMKISAGDSITGSVQYVTSGTYAGKFLLTITDTTQNETFSIYLSLSSAKRSSAEWVVEAPSSSSGVLTLAKFSTVTFTNAYATISGTTGAIDTWTAYRINMTSSSGSTVLDNTSTLTDSNSTSSFTVTYVGSSSTTTTTTTTTPTPPGRGGQGGQGRPGGRGGMGGWGSYKTTYLASNLSYETSLSEKISIARNQANLADKVLESFHQNDLLDFNLS
jgi:hypothetical protein